LDGNKNASSRAKKVDDRFSVSFKCEGFLRGPSRISCTASHAHFSNSFGCFMRTFKKEYLGHLREVGGGGAKNGEVPESDAICWLAVCYPFASPFFA